MRPGNAHEDCHSKWGIFVGLSCKVHCGKKSHFKHGAKYYSQQHQGKTGYRATQRNANDDLAT